MAKRIKLLSVGDKVALAASERAQFSAKYSDNRLSGEIQTVFANGDSGLAMYAIKWDGLRTVEVWQVNLVRELETA